MKETEITKEILRYLAGQGHFAYKQWGGMFSKKGMSDIVGTQGDTGISFYLEVKRPGGEANDDQKNFLFEAASAGAIVGVVRSVEDVHKLGL